MIPFCTSRSIVGAPLSSRLRDGFPNNAFTNERLCEALQLYFPCPLFIGSKPEYFNGVWVKNEWNRYLSMCADDESKLLIPAYKDMNPYDLPEEMAYLQAQDMSKIGALQDLLHGIQKVVRPGAAGPKRGGGSDVLPLMRRAKIYLSDRDWGNAKAYSDRVLDKDPENWEAYLIQLMVERQVTDEKQFDNCEVPLHSSNAYRHAIQFSRDEDKKRIKQYNEGICNRLREEKQNLNTEIQAFEQEWNQLKQDRTDVMRVKTAHETQVSKNQENAKKFEETVNNKESKLRDVEIQQNDTIYPLLVVGLLFASVFIIAGLASLMYSVSLLGLASLAIGVLLIYILIRVRKSQKERKAALVQTIDDNRNSKENSEAKIRSLQQDINNDNATIASLTGKIDNLNKQIGTKRGRLHAINNMLGERDSEVKSEILETYSDVEEDKLLSNTFDVVLVHYDVSNKMKVIKKVGEETGMGLADAKNAVEHMPFVLRKSVARESATKLEKVFEQLGVEIEVRPNGDALTEGSGQ